MNADVEVRLLKTLFKLDLTQGSRSVMPIHKSASMNTVFVKLARCLLTPRDWGLAHREASKFPVKTELFYKLKLGTHPFRWLCTRIVVEAGAL